MQLAGLLWGRMIYALRLEIYLYLFASGKEYLFRLVSHLSWHTGTGTDTDTGISAA